MHSPPPAGRRRHRSTRRAIPVTLRPAAGPAAAWPPSRARSKRRFAARGGRALPGHGWAARIDFVPQGKNHTAMADIAAKVLQLSPEQHEMLGHAIALAHAVHASIGGKGLGVAPGDAVYVGDSPSDGKAAQAAGMRSVGVLWGANPPDVLEGAFDVLAADVPALTKALQGFLLPPDMQK